MFALFSGLVGCTTTPTPTDGTLASTGETWSGVVTLDAERVIEAGERVTVAPGARIELAPEISLVVRGELVAIGTADEPITFTGEGWGSIVFEDGSVDASFAAVDDYVGGSTLQHVVVEGGQRAVKLLGASPYIAASTFRGNYLPPGFEVDGGAALYVEGGSTARIRDTRFEDNVAELVAFGGAVFAVDSAPILQDCEFVGNSSAYGGAVSYEVVPSPIVGCRFEGNDAFTEGGGVSLVSSVSAVLDSTFVGNHAASDGGGLHVCVTCYPHAVPFVYDSVFEGNTNNAATGEDGAAGVGAAFLRAFEDNDLVGNLAAGRPSDFGWYHPLSEPEPVWTEDVSIARNWWGTTDPAALDATVHDGSDDAAVGLASWSPPLDGPGAAPRLRVTITTLKLAYVDPGDEMPVYLTLYNPGPARAVELAVTREEDGVDLPVPDALDFPGAAPAGDGRWALELPEDSVYFTVLASETWDGAGVGAQGSWSAALLEGGAEVATSSSRYQYGP